MTNENEALRLLRLLREYHIFYTTQTKIGGNHHHPIWVQIAEALKGENHKDMTTEEYQFITGPYYQSLNNLERLVD